MTVDPSGRKEEGLRRRSPWAEKGPHAGAPPAAAEELQAALDRARQENADLEARQQALLADLQAGPAQLARVLAHDFRNTLQQSQACLERLRWRLSGQAEALDLLDRLQQAQDNLLRQAEAVKEYTAPLTPLCRPCDLGAAWRAAWGRLQARCPRRDARLREAVGAADLSCEADGLLLEQAFYCLFERALATAADSAQVEVMADEAALSGRPSLRVAVRPAALPPAGEAGLGMAFAQHVLESHGGRLDPAPGAQAVLILPRRRT
jgi:nitrogen fixation/metabolism regulation signal transduction histidine kinase